MTKKQETHEWKGEQSGKWDWWSQHQRDEGREKEGRSLCLKGLTAYSILSAMFCLACFPLDCLAHGEYSVRFYSYYTHTTTHKIRLSLWIFKKKHFIFALKLAEYFVHFFFFYSFTILVNKKRSSEGVQLKDDPLSFFLPQGKVKQK